MSPLHCVINWYGFNIDFFKKHSQKTHISPEDPRELISTKLGIASRLANLITHDNFQQSA